LLPPFKHVPIQKWYLSAPGGVFRSFEILKIAKLFLRFQNRSSLQASQKAMPDKSVFAKRLRRDTCQKPKSTISGWTLNKVVTKTDRAFILYGPILIIKKRKKMNGLCQEKICVCLTKLFHHNKRRNF